MTNNPFPSPPRSLRSSFTISLFNIWNLRSLCVKQGRLLQLRSPALSRVTPSAAWQNFAAHDCADSLISIHETSPWLHHNPTLSAYLLHLFCSDMLFHLAPIPQNLHTPGTESATRLQTQLHNEALYSSFFNQKQHQSLLRNISAKARALAVEVRTAYVMYKVLYTKFTETAGDAYAYPIHCAY